jgi:NAD-dependent dihydropyrimidine dehydrogenase PreA subunit|tara:strand:+ start:513 stop:818 length:306 start_codon:yes stop_codon:yes gene_type:complete
MTYVIVDACIDVMDQSCIDVCPVDCIYTEADEGDRMCYIEPSECIDCGACEPACPVNAIFDDQSVPGESVRFLEINALWFADRLAAREKVDALMEGDVSLT